MRDIGARALDLKREIDAKYLSEWSNKVLEKYNRFSEYR